MHGLPRRPVDVGERFDCVCVVINRGAKPRELQLQWRLDDMPDGVGIDGKTYTNLDKVEGRSRTSAPAHVLILEPGVHQMTGCAVEDLDSGEVWVMPNLFDVIVNDDDYEDADDAFAWEDVIDEDALKDPEEDELSSDGENAPPPDSFDIVPDEGTEARPTLEAARSPRHRRVAARPRPRRRQFRGDGSRRRRGCDVDNSAETGHGDAAAAT